MYYSTALQNTLKVSCNIVCRSVKVNSINNIKKKEKLLSRGKYGYIILVF